MPANKSWHDYNESLIERGRVLIDLDFIKSSNEEIKNMNKDKVGAPFQYSDNYIQFLAFLKIGFKIKKKKKNYTININENLHIRKIFHLFPT